VVVRKPVPGFAACVPAAHEANRGQKKTGTVLVPACKGVAYVEQDNAIAGAVPGRAFRAA
jgi:hypothetical protein